MTDLSSHLWITVFGTYFISFFLTIGSGCCRSDPSSYSVGKSTLGTVAIYCPTVHVVLLQLPLQWFHSRLASNLAPYDGVCSALCAHKMEFDTCKMTKSVVVLYR